MTKRVTIAVATRDGQTIAGHIGKCRDWIVFEVNPGNAEVDPVVNELERIELPKALVFHHYKDDQRHPLADCAAVIGASAGESFVKKMVRRGIEAILTAETDPASAVRAWMEQNVTPPKPRPIGELLCKIRDAIQLEK